MGGSPIKMKKNWGDETSQNRSKGNTKHKGNGFCNFEILRVLPPGKNFFCFSLNYSSTEETEDIIPKQLPCLSSEYPIWKHDTSIFEKNTQLYRSVAIAFSSQI